MLEYIYSNKYNHMYLLIDYREAAFINNLSEYSYIENDILKSTDINNVKLDYKITSLPIGDFIIQRDLEDNNTIEMIIERKSIKDLCASITDGRFREQKQRLFDSIEDASRITYIIEGAKGACIPDDDNKKPNMLSQVIVDSSILNLIYKHNYKVVQTDNKLDTFNNIVLLYKKFKNEEFKLQVLYSNVKLIKRSEKMTDNKLMNQLCLISGVSPKVADAIIKETEIKTLRDLIKKYESKSSDEEMETMLTEIIVDNSNLTKPRKVGKALSKKIYNYILF